MAHHQNRLRTCRKAKNLSIARLAQRSRVSKRTIQRLESPNQDGITPHPNTVDKLAKALQVEPEELVGESSPSELEVAHTPAPERVQIGALIAPKARLAYDLVKKRYGINATEIINVAPLLFVLLAEGSLAGRRERVEKVGESVSLIDEVMGIGADCDLLSKATTVAFDALGREEASIGKADIMGEHLLSSEGSLGMPEEPFDPAISNPFAMYLHQLAGDLDNPGVVATRADLSYGSPYGKFPDYDICSQEIDALANGCADARRALETGHARLSDIPEELMAEDAGEARAAWLAERLLDLYRNLGDDAPLADFARFVATTTPDEMKRTGEQLMAEFGVKSKDEGGDS